MIHLFATLVRDKIPAYLEGVPIPRTLSGFLDLSVKDWFHLVFFSGAVGAIGYYATKPYIDEYKKRKSGANDDSVVNLSIQKGSPKVVDVVDIESLGEKAAYCRCWRSKKFPYCDGSHNQHNIDTGDNVGPLCMKKNC
ncbi:CDGSH iron-sulfur domain-containing protein 2 homolog B-like [Styela clava]|uniref:CDGSH iron-sulfur domain-containing protein 2 homolog B-like n=1 Tax=Styela clava TaxID=7725 RepID=UPI00193A3684|nr:CDGSH iron-sulfur domain-containing protein 2 homolog B-like [Styela clava]